MSPAKTKITPLTLGALVLRKSANVTEEVVGLKVVNGAVFVAAGDRDPRYWPESEFELVKTAKAAKS